MQDIGLEDGFWRDWKWQKKTVLGPDRSRTRHSQLKALQYIPEGLSSFANWAQTWTLGLANKDEAQLWLGATIVPLIREVDNPDGSTKSKLRPVAHLETPLKLKVAVHKHADHIIALMQEQQWDFRVRDGAEAMISAASNFQKSDTNRVSMQGDISTTYGSINRLAVL